MDAHHDDVNLTPDEDLRIEAIALAENPDLAPVPVVEEQPPARQPGAAQFAVVGMLGAMAGALIVIVFLDWLGGRL